MADYLGLNWGSEMALLKRTGSRWGLKKETSLVVSSVSMTMREHSKA
jgi:hypothetical protein